MKKKAKEISFCDDYQNIMLLEDSTFLDKGQEWRKKGDYFEKYTAYEDYTPVETSGATTLSTTL